VHHPPPQFNDQPYVPAWNWQWIAQAGAAPSSWTAPLDAARVPAGLTSSQAAAGQVRELAARLAAAGETQVPVRCQILVRLRKSRVFYGDPPPRPAGATGRPLVHGPAFRCADPSAWTAPGQELCWQDPVYGQVQVRTWPGPHPKISGAARPGTPQAPRPVIRATIIRVDVQRLRGHHGPASLWLWHSGPGQPDPAACARAYLRRFGIEHTLRFARSGPGWTTPALRTPARTQTWTWLVIAALTQLRLARPLADARLPWDHSARPATPARVRRAFRAPRAAIGTPAGPPKPSGKSPGRPRGKRSQPAPRHRIIRKADIHHQTTTLTQKAA
jgi:hypothetical protein